MPDFLTAAFYKFVALADCADLRAPLLACCETNAVKGTILLAPEGLSNRKDDGYWLQVGVYEDSCAAARVPPFAAIELPVDYIGVGPIFSTTTKAAPDPVVGTELLSTIRNTAAGAKIVAIGGIGADSLLSVLSAGADSAAMVGAIFGEAALIEERMDAMNRLVSHLR